jgi:hypothetical protein
VTAEIVERTDGIPLFVEEMTKAVLEAGSEGEARQTAAAMPSPALAVPASLHASLMARLDRLGPASARRSLFPTRRAIMAAFTLSKPVERQARHMRPSSPRRVELGAESYDKQRWTSFNLVHGPTKHFQTRRVDPMGVFDDH